MSGFEACAQIREVHGPSLPVIMLTALRRPGGGAAGLRRRSRRLPAQADRHGRPDPEGAGLPPPQVPHDELSRAARRPRPAPATSSRLHEIGRDWSLIAEPAEFNRMAHRAPGRPHRRARLSASRCYDPESRTMEAALPAHSASPTSWRGVPLRASPEYRSLWNFASGRAYVSNQPELDPRLIPEIARRRRPSRSCSSPCSPRATSSGCSGRPTRPAGFTDGDVQLLSIFAGPAATFLRSRQIFDRRGGTPRASSGSPPSWARWRRRRVGRSSSSLTVTRVQKDLGYEHVAFYAPGSGRRPARLECEAGTAERRRDPEALPLGAARSRRPSRPRAARRRPSSRYPCARASTALGVLDRPEGPPRPLRRRGDEPPLDARRASSPWPCDAPTARRRRSAWRARWRRSTTWGWRPRPCRTCRPSSPGPRRRRDA